MMDDDFTLRPLTIDDFDEEYCAWFDNSDGHLDFYSGSGRVFTRDYLLNDFKNGIDSNSWFYYIIQCSNGDRVGNIKIGPIDHKNKTSDLPCLIGNRKYLGKGITTKVITIANEIAFKKYDIRRLQSGMYANNVRSIKAYIKAGWYIEGTFKGYYWIDGKSVDRVCVACLNPSYCFASEVEIEG